VGPDGVDRVKLRTVTYPSYGEGVANDDLILLDQALVQRPAERAVPMPDDDAFELFACEQALRDETCRLRKLLAELSAAGTMVALTGSASSSAISR